MSASAAVARPPDSSSRGAVPLSLVRARTASRALETWMLSEEAMALSLTEVEVEQEERAREAQRLLLQAHLEARGTGDVGPSIEVLRGGEGDEMPERLYAQRLHGRTFHTIFGAVLAQRTAYGASGAESIHPLDEEMDLPARSFTQEMQRRAVIAAIRGPFDEGVHELATTTGSPMQKLTFEQVVREAATDFDPFYAQRQVPTGEETGSILVCAVDCKGIPMVKPEKALRVVRRGKGKKGNKKRMATVAAVFTQQPHPRAPVDVLESLFREGPSPPTVGVDPRRPRAKPEHKRVWASLEKSKDEVIDAVVAEMTLRDPHREKRWVAAIDGERALQQRIVAKIPNLTLVLDLLHAVEKLWWASYCFHPQGSDAAKQWVRERTLSILQGKVSQVVKGIRQSATKRGMKGPKKEMIRRVTKYLYRNRPWMRYHEYLRDGLPIASGAVEGACKNLVKDRFERSGMRWTIPTAEALLKLRAVRLSGDFDEYWEFHVHRGHARLYPEGRWRPVEE